MGAVTCRCSPMTESDCYGELVGTMQALEHAGSIRVAGNEELETLEGLEALQTVGPVEPYDKALYLDERGKYQHVEG